MRELLLLQRGGDLEAAPVAIARGRPQLNLSTTHPGFFSLTPAQMDRLVTQEPITDHYEVEDQPFARGKFATVRRVVHRATGQAYAAKFIRKRRRSSDQKPEILHEVAVLEMASCCPHIVRLQQVFETPSEMVLILELAPGGELQTVLDSEEGMLEAHVIKFMQQILHGLSYLHERNVAHLDLKPQNLVLTGDYPHCDVKLCDFGISRYISKGTDMRELLGTPDYVAPEVLNYEPISLATDMWSVGVLAYVLLTGYSPFGGDTKQETFCNITQCKLDFPPELFEDVSDTAKEFISKLLVKEPSERLTASECLNHSWLAVRGHRLATLPPLSTVQQQSSVAVSPAPLPVPSLAAVSSVPSLVAGSSVAVSPAPLPIPSLEAVSSVLSLVAGSSVAVSPAPSPIPSPVSSPVPDVEIVEPSCRSSTRNQEPITVEEKTWKAASLPTPDTEEDEPPPLPSSPPPKQTASPRTLPLPTPMDNFHHIDINSNPTMPVVFERKVAMSPARRHSTASCLDNRRLSLSTQSTPSSFLVAHVTSSTPHDRDWRARCCRRGRSLLLSVPRREHSCDRGSESSNDAVSEMSVDSSSDRSSIISLDDSVDLSSAALSQSHRRYESLNSVASCDWSASSSSSSSSSLLSSHWARRGSLDFLDRVGKGWEKECDGTFARAYEKFNSLTLNATTASSPAKETLRAYTGRSRVISNFKLAGGDVVVIQEFTQRKGSLTKQAEVHCQSVRARIKKFEMVI